MSYKYSMQDKKNSILPEKTAPAGTSAKMRWLVAGSTIPMLGIVAAIATAPQSTLDTTPQQTIVEEVAVAPVNTSSDNGVFWRSERLQRGDSIARLLTRLQIRDAMAEQFLLQGDAARSLLQLKAGQSIAALTSDSGKLINLRFNDSNGDEVIVERKGEQLQLTHQAVAIHARPVMKSGVIQSSLFAATDKADLPDSVAVQLIEIFGSQIDFHRDLQRGDKFTVVYEQLNAPGEPLRTGKILAAEFINEGKTYRAVYFAAQQGKGGYYTADGKSLKQAFLRSPLEFSRISSGFTVARFHPVLQQWRAHKGVDYAAPIGTKIRATADGIVEFVGKQNGYGNVVTIRHQGKYSTLYGHMSGFASGVRKGYRIAQGDVIGYVGMTGWATGPHLHYEFKVDNVQQDPLKVALPNNVPLDSRNMAAFRSVSNDMMHRLNLLRNTNLARFD